MLQASCLRTSQHVNSLDWVSWDFKMRFFPTGSLDDRHGEVSAARLSDGVTQSYFSNRFASFSVKYIHSSRSPTVGIP